MDALDRRSRLAVAQNPDVRLDYVVTVTGAVDAFRVELRYVPDRLILSPDAFDSYLALLAGLEWESLERLAATILDDINNEVVARWVQITVERGERDAAGGTRHSVFLEDRQPHWDNPALIARLKRY